MALVDKSAAGTEVARAAHLRYVHDNMPGITRKGKGAGTRYFLPTGKEIREKKTLDRIRALGLPPAWTDVWICPFDNGHIQATGKDARGRKQYRYHDRWREVRDAAKYDHMLHFGAALPAIRARVHKDLARHGLPREKVLATIVYLMEKTCIRIGNDEYAHSNESYGLTTMLNSHVHIKGSTLRFAFKGKSNKLHDIALADARVAHIVRACQDLPGQSLFEYQDHDGKAHHIHSGDVNAYLREASGHDFTAKDFRTWAGTLACAICLAEGEAATSRAHGKRVIAAAIKQVAAHLGNTPAICRKCYVHPRVLEAYSEGVLKPAKKAAAKKADAFALTAEETAVLRFLARSS